MLMTNRILTHGLDVDPVLHAFVADKALAGTGLSPDRFWRGMAGALTDLVPTNRALLAKRNALQAQIDAWHVARRGQPHDPVVYAAFLTDIGYLEPRIADFSIETTGTDPEIATIAGPQLVVPVMNARYALNAANARWGSLYDALYGTDVLGPAPAPGPYDPARGQQVIGWAKAFLDDCFPLSAGSHAAVAAYAVQHGALVPPLRDPAQFAGYRGPTSAPDAIILRNNGLHLVLRIDRGHRIGRTDPAGVADIHLEAALSAILDCEDSVAAVDAADKVVAYTNLLGLMRGDLVHHLEKDGRVIARTLAPDVDFTGPQGQALSLKGRALMLVRNVGHLMTTPAILLPDGSEVPEGILDAFLTTLCALHDRTRGANSATGAIYMVKPKMHGPAEVAFACTIFDRVEAVLGLPAHTVKLGIMDEERRTSANLGACIHAARHRVAFVNTGFLDRTGDEIHTSMQAGPMLRKGDMKGAAWIAAYEANNVDIALATGFRGRAQIGKGMWAAPDLMADMLVHKIAHPQAGASCAWVPSPTAAVLHATHYHRVAVNAVQDRLAGRAHSPLDSLLTIPLAGPADWSAAEVQADIENNAQGILGYVVRWVDQGIGCSKVPDIHNVALMEDRATCRISAQALANWLLHGIIDAAQVQATMRKMAAVVDGQNAGDPGYRPMAPGFDGLAFQAACDLVFQGGHQPSGYTEPVLHAARLAVKTHSGQMA
jgi:malate synthase